MEADRVAEALQNDLFHIIVQDGSWKTLPITESIDVSAEQAFQRLIEKELEIESPAVGEGDDEAGEFPESAADFDLAERSSVGLGLLTW